MLGFITNTSLYTSCITPKSLHVLPSGLSCAKKIRQVSLKASRSKANNHLRLTETPFTLIPGIHARNYINVVVCVSLSLDTLLVSDV